MTTISIALDNYAASHDRITVDVVEPGNVDLDLTGLTPPATREENDGDGLETSATLTPDEARALAAVLVAQAEAAER